MWREAERARVKKLLDPEPCFDEAGVGVAEGGDDGAGVLLLGAAKAGETGEVCVGESAKEA